MIVFFHFRVHHKGMEETNHDRKVTKEGHSEIFECETCQKTFGRIWKLKIHEKIVHERKKFFKCDKSFIQKKDLQRHASLHDELLKKFECDICKKSFYGKNELKTHVKGTHDKVVYKCLVFSKGFTCASYLKIHTNSVHKNMKEFKCELCLKSFAQKSNLKSHVRLRHEKIKSFICEICKKTLFSQSRTRTTHQSS